jgi:hypothetical protein
MTKMKVQVKTKFIPLPPEKRAAWENSMRLLGEMLLEIYANAEGTAQEIAANHSPVEYAGEKRA